MAKPIALPHSSGLASFRNEWSTLLEAASPAHDRKRFADLLRVVDWHRLLLLAEEHGVTGHLAESVRDLDNDLIQPGIRQELADRRRAQTFFTLKLTAELFRILSRFDSEGIGALVVKGPVLAAQAYGDPAMRSYGDLDLLVRQKDVRRATELMTASGFTPAVPLRAIDAGKIPGQYLFSKPESKLIVELHNDRTLRYFPRRLPIEELFGRQIRVRLDDREAPALAVEDELVLICIHGAKHFCERLMWVADVAALVTRQTSINWERVADSARVVGAERMLHTALLLASDLLNTRLPDKVQAAVQGDVVAARLSKQCGKWLPAAGFSPPGLFERAFFRMRMRGGLISAPVYLLRLSFSPTEDDWMYGAGAEVKRHSFLDAVRRPFRLARKYGRGSKT